MSGGNADSLSLRLRQSSLIIEDVLHTGARSRFHVFYSALPAALSQPIIRILFMSRQL